MGLSLLSQPAQAINLTFSFNGGDASGYTISKTVDGVTINLSNINSYDSTFFTESTGIQLSNSSGFGNQFDISFSQPVQFLSYSVTNSSSLSSGQTATFDLSNPNGTGSTGNNLANLGTSSFSNQFSLNAGQTSTLAATLSNPVNLSNYAQLQSITVDVTAVPWETDALSVIGSTVLFAGGLWARNKFAKPRQIP